MACFGEHHLTEKAENDQEAQQQPHGSNNCDKAGPENTSKLQNSGQGSVIASHYNTEEIGLEKRNTSRILYLRNFNNWIKSMLIAEYLNETVNKKKHGSPIVALDMCCGKGGDMFKWMKGNIKYLVCCDIAEVAVENCKKRYDDLKCRFRDIFSAEFITADVTKVRIREKYKDPSMRFDIVSCQFAFHYCFESLPQAEKMLQNVSECLKKDGYFIGTMPDANAIVEKQRAAGSTKFGNDVYKISFEDEVIKSFPLFGGKYNFQLDGVVDCPEFLVYFKVLIKLAEKYGLKLVNKVGFHEYFYQKKDEGRFLLNRMSALETYPPPEGVDLIGSESEDYCHGRDFCKERKVKSIGTLSKQEWEVASLYLVFAFQKVSDGSQ